MANPRQRRKARSSHKPVHHSRQAKKLLKKQPPIRGPKGLQEAWDKHKTVRQNYAALGLAVSLNPRASGGAEHSASVTEARTGENEATFINGSDPPSFMNSGSDPTLPNGLAKGLGRIVRDEAGLIIAVETNDDADPSPPTTHGLGLVETAAAAALTPESQSWVLLGRTFGAEKPKPELIGALPDVSANVLRFSSKGEVSFLQKLISKYGHDVEAMARDRRLNPDQRTGGEIRRAINKAGGLERLRVNMS
ncbi:ribosome biogenesis protein Nop16 [Lactifluus subvellereus]|nr:ribosome biogenesis protein Nop16 [Lactifluus subvellereus]